MRATYAQNSSSHSSTPVSAAFVAFRMRLKAVPSGKRRRKTTPHCSVLLNVGRTRTKVQRNPYSDRARSPHGLAPKIHTGRHRLPMAYLHAPEVRPGLAHVNPHSVKIDHNHHRLPFRRIQLIELLMMAMADPWQLACRNCSNFSLSLTHTHSVKERERT